MAFLAFHGRHGGELGSLDRRLTMRLHEPIGVDGHVPVEQFDPRPCEAWRHQRSCPGLAMCETVHNLLADGGRMTYAATRSRILARTPGTGLWGVDGCRPVRARPRRAQMLAAAVLRTDAYCSRACFTRRRPGWMPPERRCLVYHFGRHTMPAGLKNAWLCDASRRMWRCPSHSSRPMHRTIQARAPSRLPEPCPTWSLHRPSAVQPRIFPNACRRPPRS